ncbi:MAG: hypothetical protein QOG03_1881 [Actinomycetota bacterium]|nr:hypothetical protein [Actinomycetota bacterium]
MDLVAGPFLAVTGLLIAGGLLKVRHPDDTARALRQAGLRVGRGAVRVAGALEAVVTAAAVLTGNRVAVVWVAASYLAFAAFVAVARQRRWPLASCGCLGKIDTPPSVGHVAIDVAAASVSLAVAVRPLGSLGDVLSRQPLGGIPLLAMAAVTAYLVTLVMGPQAQLAVARAEVRR